jgi:hypothetical protein
METTTSPLVRPAIGTAVRVTFPGSAGYDAETVEGIVIDLDDNSLGVFAGEAIGETFTLYDIEQADPAVTVEVLA